DEFIVLISDMRSPAVIGDVASRIQIVMAEALEFDEGRMAVGASIGVSEFPADAASALTSNSSADAAMYAAKASPQCVCVRYQDLVRSGAPDETGRVASGGSR
ncbi:GGDEF domain-containing protein, partial [Burkholderia cenocepacia]|nr:GGDEF domain-containing protein [Burkholderia cenocepacia]